MLIKEVTVEENYEKTLRMRRLIFAGLLLVGVVGFICYHLLGDRLPDFARGFYLGGASGLFVNRRKISGNIQKHASVTESRHVLYGTAWYRPVRFRCRDITIYLYRKHLLKGLDSINEAIQTTGLYHHLASGDLDGISLAHPVKEI